jgi:hypothetical protein
MSKSSRNFEKVLSQAEKLLDACEDPSDCLYVLSCALKYKAEKAGNQLHRLDYTIQSRAMLSAQKVYDYEAETEEPETKRSEL